MMNNMNARPENSTEYSRQRVTTEIGTPGAAA
jgi:hypothetical protein